MFERMETIDTTEYNRLWSIKPWHEKYKNYFLLCDSKRNWFN